jgi:hypothetical protein
MQAILTRYSHLPGNTELVFRTLCALLSEQPDKVDWSGFTQQDWLLLEKIAVDEGVAAMAYYLLSKSPETYHLSTIDSHTFQILSEREAITAVRNAWLFKRLAEILQAFHAVKIPVVLLKGADLAHSLYPEPGLRWMTDLDLLIHQESFDQALGIVCRQGYHEYLPEAFPGLNRLLSYHTHMVREDRVPVLLELHWSLLGSEAFEYSVSMDWFWENLESSETRGHKNPPETLHLAFSLNSTANLQYLSAHQMLQHGGESVTLLWLLDLHRLIMYRGDEIEWRMLADQANVFGWSAALKAALQVVMETFNTQLPDGFISTLQAGEVVSGSLVELKSKQAPTHVLGEGKKIKSLNQKGQLVLFLALVFPSPAYMRWRYDPHPEWIFPIYYFFRWVGILWDGVRTLIQIIAMLIHKD